jgi:hypothetical protein
MSILAKLALVIGGPVFCMIVFIVCLAFINYLESALEKPLPERVRCCFFVKQHCDSRAPDEGRR